MLQLCSSWWPWSAVLSPGAALRAQKDEAMTAYTRLQIALQAFQHGGVPVMTAAALEAEEGYFMACRSAQAATGRCQFLQSSMNTTCGPILLIGAHVER